MKKNLNPLSNEYWDKIARKMEKPLFQEQIALYKRKEHIKLISSWISSNKVKSILKTDLFEEATGKDFFLDFLNSISEISVGMDISSVVVKEAKQKLKKNPLVVCNVTDLSFKNESFEIIVSNSTLDHLPFNIVHKAISEFWRVIKPGGYLILTLDNRHNPLHLLSHWIRGFAGWYHTERCYSVKEVKRLLEEGKFCVEDITAIYHIPFGVNFLAKILERVFKERANKLIKFIIDLFEITGKLPTKVFTGRFIALKAEKIQSF